jgi:hypothetical protein
MRFMPILLSTALGGSNEVLGAAKKKKTLKELERHPKESLKL